MIEGWRVWGENVVVVVRNVGCVFENAIGMGTGRVVACGVCAQSDWYCMNGMNRMNE